MAKHYPSIILLCSLATFWSDELQAQRTVWPVLRDQGRSVAATHPHTASRGFRSDSIWGDDFSDSAHWTFGTLDSTAYNWVIGTAVPGGTYPMPAINSTSAANGYALFDSGLPCGPDNGYLAIASPIDLSAEAHVQLQFEQFYRKFQGHTYVDVSNDGSTWTPFEVNVQLNVGQYTANAEVFHLDISSVAALQDSVWFRFRYTGNCDYAWMVDDVALVEQPAHELQLVTAATTSWSYDTNVSFDSVYYSAMPQSEIRPRALNMTYFNAGYLPASNVMANITTSDGYDESQLLDTIAPGDTVRWFAPLWTPTTTIGEHALQFSVVADDIDADSTDNADSLTIQVSGTQYARDMGIPDSEVGEGADQFKAGNWFHMSQNEEVCMAWVAFSSESATGIEVNVQVLDTAFQVVMESDYHTVVASDLSSVGEAVWVPLCFMNWIMFEQGTDYLVVLQHFGGADLRVATSGYSAPQSSLLYNAGTDSWHSVSTTPMVKLDFDCKGCVGGVDEMDQVPSFDLSPCTPNPANDKAQIQFTLKNPMPASLTLQGMNGKLLRTLVHGPMGTGQHQVEINTRNLDAGVYFYTLHTPTGMATKRMVVMH